MTRKGAAMKVDKGYLRRLVKGCTLTELQKLPQPWDEPTYMLTLVAHNVGEAVIAYLEQYPEEEAEE